MKGKVEDMTLLVDALVDTTKMIPFLLMAYVLVAFLEHHYGDRMGRYVTRLGRGGPIIGALVGCFPQCGFSVLAAALYTKRLVSGGTLLAVFLATSDEAIPILFALPGKGRIILPLILIKVIIAIIAGLAFDLIFGRKPDQPKTPQEHTLDEDRDEALHHTACCAHEVSSRPTWLQALVKHPLLHTLKVFAYLLVLTVGMNYLLDRVGNDRLASLLQHGSALQPTLASFIGLIPNCFASVVLAELYAKGVLSFGSLVAGLCAGSGLGLIVLVQENKNWRNTLLILASLLGVSIFWGMILQLLPWF
jgi:uncharacterized membrane protein YraQ (UPF0718 family)